MRPIYLDHHATTPCDARVVEAMSPYFSGEFGNAASRTHAFGWRAGEAVEEARTRVAALVGARAREIVFTSGATESNNLALVGIARALRGRRDGVVTCATEHRAVLDPCEALAREGFRVTVVRVDRRGRVDLEALRGALDERTALVSIMHANNEIGVVQPVAEISELAHRQGALVHTDAAQSAGKIPCDVGALGVDLLSLTAHKLYGPKGVGALYVRRGAVRPQPLLQGGGHERGLRPGTLPVPLCVGFGVACEIAGSEREAEATRLRALRDHLAARLQQELEGVTVHGDLEQRLPGNLNASFAGVESEALLAALPEVALSTGSACTSAKPEPSHVLRALGLRPAEALSALRFGLGRGTTREEIDAVVERIVREVARLRALSPTWPRRAGVRH